MGDLIVEYKEEREEKPPRCLEGNEEAPKRV